MIVLAAVGAVVLAMVSWVALKEAQQMGGAVRRLAPGPRPRPAVERPARASGPVLVGHRAWRVQVDGAPTVDGAAHDEALAASAALWHVLVDDTPQ